MLHGTAGEGVRRAFEPQKHGMKMFTLRQARPDDLDVLTDLEARSFPPEEKATRERFRERLAADRKSTRLNSSHLVISYAVFCLKKVCSVT